MMERWYRGTFPGWMVQAEDFLKALPDDLCDRIHIIAPDYEGDVEEMPILRSEMNDVKVLCVIDNPKGYVAIALDTSDKDDWKGLADNYAQKIRYSFDQYRAKMR